MKTFIKQLMGAMFLLSSALMGTAYATACGNVGDGLDTTDVTFRTVASDDCSGLYVTNTDGNDSLNFLNDNTIFGGGWDATVKDDDPDGIGANTVIFSGIEWNLTANLDGTWTLTSVDVAELPDYPVAVDIAVVVNGGGKWAAYLFDDEVFSVDSTSPGTFVISWTAGQSEQTPDLSHMTLYFREGVCPPEHPDCGEDPDPLPEPTTMWLLGLGLLGLARSTIAIKKNQY